MLLLAACFLLPTQADATEKTGVYIAPKFVLNVQHAKGELPDTGFTSWTGSETEANAGGAIAVGYDFAPKFALPIRAELEYGAYGNLSKTSTLAVRGIGNLGLKYEAGIQTLLANVYWDITEWNNFTPYVGAGLGVAFVKTEGTLSLASISDSISETKEVFAGQIGVGCSYAFNDTVAVDLGYRFLMMGNGEVEYSGIKLYSKENYAHQIMLGLRVTF